MGAGKLASPINNAEYQAWLDGDMASPPTTPDSEKHNAENEATKQGVEGEAPYPKSFAEVAELITGG